MPRGTSWPGPGETRNFPGLADAPIRWIVEDAIKFAKRELRRGARYDAVILDPPSYGHGPRGEVWRLATQLPRLLEMCHELTGERAEFMLLTCHTPGYDPEQLGAMVAERCAFVTMGCEQAKASFDSRGRWPGVAVWSSGAVETEGVRKEGSGFRV